MEDFLTIDEAAAYLKLPRGALARMRYLGTGPAFYKPLPKSIYYAREALDEWVRGSQIEPSQR